MQHTRLIRAAVNDYDSDSGMDEEIDANEIQTMKKSGGRALGFMPDNGEGDVEIWRIDDHMPVSVGADKFGVLLGSKSYVMKYHYRNKKNDEGIVIYYWQVYLKKRKIRKYFQELLNWLKFPNLNRASKHQAKIKQHQQFTHLNWTRN